MIIRPANFSDIYIIHQLANKIWPVTYKNIISDEQINFMLDKMYSEEALTNQINAEIEFLLAEDENKPIGFAAYSLTAEPPNKIYKLHKLYILPTEHGKGTGKKLVDEVIKLAQPKGGKVLELNVNRANPALGFYQKLGFEIYQEVDIPYFKFVMNDYVMRISL
ncbi:MAG: GNAT family N-acetyltransferase [Daejeonella sp.]